MIVRSLHPHHITLDDKGTRLDPQKWDDKKQKFLPGEPTEVSAAVGKKLCDDNLAIETTDGSKKPKQSKTET